MQFIILYKQKLVELSISFFRMISTCTTIFYRHYSSQDYFKYG